MSAKTLLANLHSQTAGGLPVHVEDSFLGGTVRLVYRYQPCGQIVNWQVEGPGMSFPLKFKTEQEAREYIRRRWNLEPRTKRWGEP